MKNQSDLVSRIIARQHHFAWCCEDYTHNPAADSFLQEYANGPLFDDKVNGWINALRNLAVRLMRPDFKHTIDIQAGTTPISTKGLEVTVNVARYMEIHECTRQITYSPDGWPDDNSIFDSMLKPTLVETPFRISFGTVQHQFGHLDMAFSDQFFRNFSRENGPDICRAVTELINIMPNYTRYGRAIALADALTNSSKVGVAAVADEFNVMVFFETNKFVCNI